jgi:hypothetical protein
MSERSIAAHLDITIDPNNPPPEMSIAFASIRQNVHSTWEKFEAAEEHLARLDEEVHNELLNYISSHQHATPQQVQAKKNSLTIRMYESPIAEAETCYRELERGIKDLEEAARKEAETVEGRATLELDIKVMKNCRKTTREIIDAARMQFDQARKSLKTS